MNWVDYVIVVIVAVGVFNGFSKGIIRQIISIVGFSAGLIIASQHSTDLAARFSFISDQGLANIVAFAMIVIGVTAVSSFIGNVLHRIVGFMMFGIFDRLAGAAFGALLSAMIIEVGLIITGKLPLMGPGVSNSTIAKRFFDFAPMVAQFLPPEFDTILKVIGAAQ